MPATLIRSSRSAPFRQLHWDSGPRRCGHRGHRRSDLPAHRDLARGRDAAGCAGRSRSARRPGCCLKGRSTRGLPGHRRRPGCARRPPALSSPWRKTYRRPPAAAPPWDSLSQCSECATCIRRRRSAGPSPGTRLHPGARARSRSPRPPRKEPSRRSPGRAAIHECGYAAADGLAGSSRSPAPAAREAIPIQGIAYPGPERDEEESGDAHEEGRHQRPSLWLVGEPHREHR